MGVPLNLKDIQSGFLTASAFNENNSLIEAALAKALNRTSNATDNAMEVDLDMGLFNINNVADASLIHQAINYGQAQNILAASSDQVTSTADIESFIATADQTLFTFSTIEYIQNVNALLVYVNGVYQLSGTDYTETSTTSITFDTGLTAGDIVVVLGARFNAEVFVTQSQANADQAETFANEAEGHAINAEQSATDAEAAQTAAEDAAGYKLGINTQSGTSYTLVASDEGDLVRMTNAGANTVTVPTNASVPFEIGTIVNIRQSGSGTTTISPATGVTINAPFEEFTTDGEEFGVAIVKVGTNEWDLVKSYAGVRNTEFDSSISGIEGSSGYQKLPSGLIMQWGRATINTGQPSIPVTVTLPIANPTATINVQAVYGDSTDSDGDNLWVDNLTASSFDITQNGFAGTTAYWFALGV